MVQEACLKCGRCLPACSHDAVSLQGNLALATELAAGGGAILILGVEAEVHFHPHPPERLINGCHSAGFDAVYRGILGDELVAAEYRRLWESSNGGTMIRSTCPVVVDAVQRHYPDLVKYLAPVRTPVQAEADYVRAKQGADTKIVYGGVCLTEGGDAVDAAITLDELAELLKTRGVDIESESAEARDGGETRRRHESTAGGLALPVLLQEPQASTRFRKMRGLSQLDAIEHAMALDSAGLGFVDLLPCEGCLDHPLMGPREERFRRVRIQQGYEPPRSPVRVVDPAYEVDVTASFEPMTNGHRVATDDEIEGVIRQIGTTPDGSHWDCGGCGYATCRRFAAAHVIDRATLRQCPPYQERRAVQAQQEAAVDELTGLATYRVLRDRLRQEVARARRTREPFAVLFADMDQFKAVNDRYGHKAGNDVLGLVAGVMAKTVRTTDMAARYGGDEFVVLLIATDAQGAAKVGEEVRQLVETVGKDAGYPVGLVTVSVGVAHFSGDGGSDDVLDAADQAQYLAKGAGGNRVVIAA